MFSMHLKSQGKHKKMDLNLKIIIIKDNTLTQITLYTHITSHCTTCTHSQPYTLAQ